MHRKAIAQCQSDISLWSQGMVLVNNDASHCDKAVTLECLRELYSFNYTLVSRDKNSIAVGGCYAAGLCLPLVAFLTTILMGSRRVCRPGIQG